MQLWKVCLWGNSGSHQAVWECTRMKNCKLYSNILLEYMDINIQITITYIPFTFELGPSSNCLDVFIQSSNWMLCQTWLYLCDTYPYHKWIHVLQGHECMKVANQRVSPCYDVGFQSRGCIGNDNCNPYGPVWYCVSPKYSCQKHWAQAWCTQFKDTTFISGLNFKHDHSGDYSSCEAVWEGSYENSPTSGWFACHWYRRSQSQAATGTQRHHTSVSHNKNAINF